MTQEISLALVVRLVLVASLTIIATKAAPVSQTAQAEVSIFYDLFISDIIILLKSRCNLCDDK